MEHMVEHMVAMETLQLAAIVDMHPSRLVAMDMVDMIDMVVVMVHMAPTDIKPEGIKQGIKTVGPLKGLQDPAEQGKCMWMSYLGTDVLKKDLVILTVFSGFAHKSGS